MKENVILGGYLIDEKFNRKQLDSTLNPDNLIIKKTLEKVSNTGKGVVVMQIVSKQVIGPEKLELYADNGKFLLMLGINEEDGDYSVRTLTNKIMSSDFLSILGENYPATAVTNNFACVCDIFYEFSRFGDVSLERLS